jgi:hypothetical protein
MDRSGDVIDCGLQFQGCGQVSEAVAGGHDDDAGPHPDDDDVTAGRLEAEQMRDDCDQVDGSADGDRSWFGHLVFLSECGHADDPPGIWAGRDTDERRAGAALLGCGWIRRGRRRLVAVGPLPGLDGLACGDPVPAGLADRGA